MPSPPYVVSIFFFFVGANLIQNLKTLKSQPKKKSNKIDEKCFLISKKILFLRLYQTEIIIIVINNLSF
jgi:hypothetical protein